MKECSISLTKASRNFADCVNRVRYQGAIFVLQKNGVPVARLVPIDQKTASKPSAPDEEGPPRSTDIW